MWQFVLTQHDLVRGEKASFGSTEIANDLLVKGNLTVKGDSSIVESTKISMYDPIIEVGKEATAATADTRDRGILFHYNDTQAGNAIAKGFIGYDDSDGKFALLKGVTITDEVIQAGETEGTLKIQNLESSAGVLALNGAGGVTLNAGGADVNITGNNIAVLLLNVFCL